MDSEVRGQRVPRLLGWRYLRSLYMFHISHFLHRLVLFATKDDRDYQLFLHNETPLDVQSSSLLLLFIQGRC